MGAPKRPVAGMDELQSIAEALPSHTRRRRHTAQQPAAPMPASLPQCFAEVWRRRTSKLPAHRRERASLEAVASTIPEEAKAATGSTAAGVYLAALVIALKRVVQTTKPVKMGKGEGGSRTGSVDDEDLVDTPGQSRRTRKRARKRERDAIAEVKDMKGPDVHDARGGKLAAANASSSGMDVEDEEKDGNTAGGSDDFDIELVASLVYLIGLAVRGSTQAIINAKCEEILLVVMSALDHVSGKTEVARHCSVVFAGVLAVVDSTSWSKPTVQRAYLRLLGMTGSSDPKTRRKGKEALQALLECPRGAVIASKTSTAAGAHFVSEMQRLTIELENALDTDCVQEAVSPALFIHLLTGIAKFGVALKSQDAARVAKQLVLLACKDFPNISVFAYDALSNLFDAREERELKTSSAVGEEFYEELRVKSTAVVPQSDLGKLLVAITDHAVPQDCQDEIFMSHARCVAEGSIAFFSYHEHSAPPSSFVTNVVRILTNAMDPTSARPEVVKSVCGDLLGVLRQRWVQAVPAVFSQLEVFIGYQFKPLWTDVVPLLKRYLETGMAAGQPQMKDVVSSFAQKLIDMRSDAKEANDRKLMGVLHGVLASTIRGGGAACILSVVEVKYDAKEHITNAWILPMLRDHTCGSPLALFASDLLPVAKELAKSAEAAAQDGHAVEAKNAGIYKTQVWSLLPGFCNRPTDLGQTGVMNTAFQAIHTCFTSGDLMSMYTSGVGGLRQLSLSLLALAPDDPTTAPKKASFASRLKKLFPTIVEITGKTTADRRGLILEALTKAAMATGDPSLVSSLLHKSIRRLLKASVNTGVSGKAEDGDNGEANIEMDVEEADKVRQARHAAADVAIALAESGILPRDAAEVGYLKQAMSPMFLDSSDSSLQKKAYRATAMLVSLGAMSQDFDAVITFIQSTGTASGSVAPGAKATRLGLVQALVNQHLSVREEKKVEFLNLATGVFLSEVVLGTRDTSEKTRAASFGTLVAMARAWHTSSSGEGAAGLRQFFITVAAGLGGKTVSMLAATLTSLGRLMYDFRGEATLYPDFATDVDSLFASATMLVASANDSDQMADSSGHEGTEMVIQPGPIAILLRHRAAEVQKAALGLMKIATSVLNAPTSRLVAVLPGILPGLVHVAARSKKQEIRLKVRVILERLLRKCGREVLETHFPEEHLKLLAAVRKKYSRDLVKKHEAKAARRVEAGEPSTTERGDGENRQDGSGEDDSDMEYEDSDSDVERELLDGDELLSRGKRASEDRVSGALRMAERSGDVVDLLDPRSAHSVLTHGEVQEASAREKLDQRRKRYTAETAIKYTDDGRPIFVESDGDSGGAEQGSVMNDDDSDDDSDIEDRKAPKKSGPLASRKRPRRDNDGHGSKRMKGSFGEEYRSKRGAGDVKRPGRPDPHAYIPLGANMLGVQRNRHGGKSGGGKGSGSLQKMARLGTNKGNNKRGGRTGVPGRR